MVAGEMDGDRLNMIESQSTENRHLLLSARLPARLLSGLAEQQRRRRGSKWRCWQAEKVEKVPGRLPRDTEGTLLQWRLLRRQLQWLLLQLRLLQRRLLQRCLL